MDSRPKAALIRGSSLRLLCKARQCLLASAGCVAAVTGFLLNFLIDEHATSATTALDDVPQRVPSAITPLSPDQHRLTEDGDLDTSAQQEAFGKLKQQSPQIASLLDQKVVQARQHIQAELGATDRGVSSASKSAAIPNAVQQIKVCATGSAAAHDTLHLSILFNKPNPNRLADIEARLPSTASQVQPVICATLP